MYKETGTTLDETTHFKIEEVSKGSKTRENCEHCNEELEEIYWRDDSVYDLIVLECPKCKMIYAYLIELATDSLVSWESEGEPINDHSAPFTKNLKKAFPKNCVSEYAKAISKEEHKNRELNKIINAKLPQLYKIGLSLATINLARSTVASEIKDNTTTKQLTVLIASAIYARANNVNTTGGSWQHKGEGATERQLEEIFGVSRKTIRKWAETFAGRRIKGAT
ncbi:MAG: hypothetical protein ABSF65_06090 [Candidatus Bathyarchaeia archaeon]